MIRAKQQANEHNSHSEIDKQKAANQVNQLKLNSNT